MPRYVSQIDVPRLFDGLPDVRRLLVLREPAAAARYRGVFSRRRRQ